MQHFNAMVKEITIHSRNCKNRNIDIFSNIIIKIKHEKDGFDLVSLNATKKKPFTVS